MNARTQNPCFTNLGKPRKIWAIPAIHGQIEPLIRIHDEILARIRPGERIVYLGNYTGYSEQSAACIDEILTFRRMVLSQRGMLPGDLVYLRGSQEEMWQKLLQIQFAPDPTNVLLWMLGNGISTTLASYGLSAHDGIEACRSGVMGLTKWTNTVREAVRRHKGHEIFSTQFTRAAMTPEDAQYPMLFVHAGLNVKKPLHEQGDHLWWSSCNFEAIESPYLPFQKVIRGYDAKHRGQHLNCITATLDDGCGFGGKLVAAAFLPDGEIVDMLEA